MRPFRDAGGGGVSAGTLGIGLLRAAGYAFHAVESFDRRVR